MIWWSVVVRMEGGDLSDESLEAEAERLRPHSAALSVGKGTYSVQLSVEADTAEDALRSGVAIVNPASRVIEVMAVTHEELERELLEPSLPPLASVVEIGEMAGVSRQRADQLAQRADFPTPVLETRVGRLWVRAAVERWLEGWDRRQGRPSKRYSATTA